MPICKLKNGVELAYRISGAGQPFTFIHGVGAYKESWDGVIEALPQGCYRTCTYDLRGHGDSAKIPGPYSLEAFCRDLTGLLDALSIERTVLAGFSLGGLIAQAFALSQPQRVEKLVLISTVADRTDDEKRRVAERAKDFSSKGSERHLADSLERWFTKDFIEQRPDILEERLRRVRENDPQCYAATYQVLAGNDLADHLGSIRIPTLVMTGENDIGSTPRMAAVMKERIADCRLRILPDLRHSLLLEAPALVAQEIERFLADTDR